jgi:radical SAM-linked protein
MRLIVKFEKTGPAAMTSHLDLQRNMQRALRRSALPVRYSQGFNPHTLLSFVTALPLGYESLCEVMDVDLDEAVPALEALERLNAALPAGLRALAARVVADGFPTLSAKCDSAAYHVTFSEPHGGAADRFLSQESVVVQKKSKSGMKAVDIRPMVYRLAETADGLALLLKHTNNEALRPDLLLSAMQLDDYERIVRTQLLDANGADVFAFVPKEGIQA